MKGQPKLANEIRVADLDREIEESERKVVAAEEAVDKAVHRLTQWLGFQMRFHPRGEVVATETCAPVPAPPSASDERFNPFSSMVRDFAGREIPPELDRAVIAVYGPLAQCRLGRFWMRFVWDAAERGDRKSRVADGGLSLLLQARPPPGEAPPAAAPEAGAGAAEQDRGEGDEREAKRKSGSVLSGGVGFLCEQFAPLWEEQHLRKVFRQFGIELEAVPRTAPRAQRLEAAERIAAEGREVLREANVGARLRPRNAAAVRALGKFAPWLQLALEANNTARGLAALRDGKLGAYEALSVTGSVNDSLAALNEVGKVFRPASTGLARATPVFAIVGGTLDTITGAMDASNAYEENGWTGRTGGHTLRSAGGALAVVGGLLMIANPVGLAGGIVILVGVAAQFAGSWIVEASSELREFLRSSPWGRGDVGVFSTPGEVMGQHRALSRAVYRFDARMTSVTTEGLAGIRRLVLRLRVAESSAKWLPSGARWTVEARGDYGSSLVWKGWELGNRSVPSPSAFDGELVLDIPVPGVVLRRDDQFVRVASAEISLAPCADARHRVTKTLSQHEFDPSPLFGSGSSSPAR